MNRLAKRLLLFAVIFALGFLFAMHWAPSRVSYPVQGIDITYENGGIVWPTAAADGVDFAYIRATEGAEMHDPRFAENWAGAAQAGVRRGATHFFALCRLASDQATNFIANVPREPKALPAALILKLTGNCAERPAREVVLKEIEMFVRMAEAHSGKPVILSLSPDFEDYYHVGSAIDRQLWLRSMAFPPSYGNRPWVIWHASAMRRVAGIAGPVNWLVTKS
jgi:lysozyme